MIIKYVFNLILFLTNSLLLYKFLHVYQLKSYNFKRYFKYFCNFKGIFLIFCFIFYIFELFIKNILFYIVVNAIFYILNLTFIKNFIKSKKTPINFTKKLIRIDIFSILILFILSLYNNSFLLFIIASALVPPIANFINIYDKIKNHLFIKQAVEKLKNFNVKIIAITGSNGKTSVKNILLKFLSTKHKTLATPSSFNTPLGIAKFINENLSRDTEFLILEYGARNKNDIKKLCNLFGADYGILTCIHPQHLETFKSTENVFIAKKQLLDYLQNKPCVISIDNLYLKRISTYNNIISTSIYSKADIFATDLHIENKQTHFVLNYNNKSYSLHTPLLGRHQISNICLAFGLALKIGIPIPNLLKEIEYLSSTPHRLNLIETDINILDDSYNCSIASACEALWILKQFPNKKMIVTPGIIEGGKNQYELNFKLGEEMNFCSFCILVGETNKQALTDGIINSTLEKNRGDLAVKSPLNKPKIIYAKTLEEAKNSFKLLNSNDSLLLLNDLPDDYI